MDQFVDVFTSVMGAAGQIVPSVIGAVNGMNTTTISNGGITGGLHYPSTAVQPAALPKSGIDPLYLLLGGVALLAVVFKK